MTLQQLYYFRTLAKLQHFSKTAEVLSISQPSLSYSIAQLETELGVLLFDRKGKTISINSYGEIFLSYVESAINTLEQGIENITLLTSSQKDSIKIGYIYSLTDLVLSKVIEKFYKNSSNNSISFDFINNLNDIISKNLSNHTIDLAFCAYPPKDATSIKLFEQELFLFVPKSHRLANEKEISLTSVREDDFIFYSKKTALRLLTDEIFKDLGIVPYTKFEVDECNAALSFLYLNSGISVMPIVPGINYDKVSVIKITESIVKRNIYLAFNDDSLKKPNIKHFINFVMDYYSNTEVNTSY